MKCDLVCNQIGVANLEIKSVWALRILLFCNWYSGVTCINLKSIFTCCYAGMRMMPMPPGLMPMMRPPPMGRFAPPPPGRPPASAAAAAGGAVHYPSQDPTRMGSVPKPGETEPPAESED